MDCKEQVIARLKALTDMMEKQGIDAVVLRKPENVFYFSNFNPVINSHPVFVVVPREGEPCLLVHSLRYAHACREGAVDQVKTYGKWGDCVPLALHPVDAVRELLGQGTGCLGLELSECSVLFYRELEEKLKPAGVRDISSEISKMKLIKDSYEISCIRRSAALVDRGVETAIEYLRQGCSEAEASTQGQYAMRKLWQERFPQAEVCGFGTSEGGMIDSLHVWCLSNTRIAYGCDCPGAYRPVRGDLTLPMAWAKTDGYHAENERTLIVGELDRCKQNAYDGMLQAREQVFQILKPDVTFEALYLAAAGVFSQRGFDSILPGRIGHGVGCSAHEYPSLERGNQIPLAPGMVITVEPGLMDQGWGGARHSDTVLITEDGYECLTKTEAGTIRI